MQSWLGLRKWLSMDIGLVVGAIFPRAIVTKTLVAKTLVALVGLCLLAASSAAAASGKDDKAPTAQNVDSGSFGVFMNGRRVATETFSVHQSSTGSSIVSEFKSEAGADKAEQRSEWQMGPSGDLRKYEWKEVSPGQSQAVVVPNQEFLTERFRASPQDKELEQPFMLPASSSLLDDYFFVQREVLVWKYLASSCKQDKGALQCPLKQRVQFGALNPHSRSSISVTLEFAGREKVTIRGAEIELNRLDLKGESGTWTLWVDDQYKLQRILIQDGNTEVVRD
jgi:hypothetical protein